MNLANRRSSNSPAGIIIRHVRGSGLEEMLRGLSMRQSSEQSAKTKRDPSTSVGMTERLNGAGRRRDRKRWLPGRSGELLCWEESFEGGFVEDRDAEGLSFVEFRAGVAAYDYVAGLFADCAAGFAAVGCYELLGLFAGAALEGAGEDECLAGELRAFGRGTLLF